MKTILAVSTILIFTAVGARAEEWRLEYVGGYQRAVIERPLAGSGANEGIVVGCERGAFFVERINPARVAPQSTVKFDDGPAAPLNWDVQAAPNSMRLYGVIAFTVAAMIARSDRVAFQEGTAVEPSIFGTAGARDVIGPVVEACGMKLIDTTN